MFIVPLEIQLNSLNFNGLDWNAIYDEYSQQFMVGTAEEIVERLRPMADAGVNYFITYLPRVAYEPEMVERFAKEVVPAVS